MISSPKSKVATAVAVRPTSSISVVPVAVSTQQPAAISRELAGGTPRWLAILWAHFGKFAVLVLALMVIVLSRACTIAACWGQSTCVFER